MHQFASIWVLSEIVLSRLEKILAVLPEPSSVDVAFAGKVDYGPVFSQVGLNAKMNGPKEVRMSVKMDKKDILDAFRKEYQRVNSSDLYAVLSPHFVILDMYWTHSTDGDGGYGVQITPEERKARIRILGLEPPFLEQLKGALQEHSFKFSIEYQ